MAEKARELLRSVYGVPAEKIEVIPHGIPDFPFVEPDEAKAKFGFSGRTVILTFGLLSPNKGIEVMIDAMPSILKSRPDAVYVVLGATHPNLVRRSGRGLSREPRGAGARGSASKSTSCFSTSSSISATLLGFISMCDVYVTPYLNEAQMTSGTLAYSFGLGKAVVSTPYWHARELLADGRGILVPFGDSAAIGSEIAGLLTDDARRQAMRKRAYAASRSMTWERIAERYVAVFENARRGHRLQSGRAARSKCARARPAAAGDADRSSSVDVRRHRAVPACDPFGSRPARTAIASTTTPARCCWPARSARPGEQRLSEPLTARFAAFVQHAWNPDTEAVSQLHELRSQLARGQGLGGQSWAHALGPGRMRARRCQPVAPALGRRLVRRGAADDGALSLAARLGLHAAGAGRLLRGRRRGCRRQANATPARRPADGYSGSGRDRGLGLVRGRACLRQCALAPGVDRDGDFAAGSPPMSRPACGLCAG